MRLFLTILVIVLLVHSLVLLGLLGYSAVTGRLGEQQRQQYLATWRGETLVAPPEEVAETVEEESPQEAAARIAEAQMQTEILTNELQQKMATVRDMKISVELAQAQLNKDRRELQEQMDAFQKELISQKERAQSEGFQKALKNYSQMKPKYVVADFMQMDDELVAEYLGAMKSDVATKILNQFRDSEEQAKRLRVMELLRKNNRLTMN
ncbi:MAG: hypothetical protein JW709_12200 [Sedimentisphaerales bacterium]|nr:hypothetical protein [Sedimentisphaerales bacterium]